MSKPFFKENYKEPGGTFSDRFSAKVRKAPVDRCWEWTGAKTTAGYGALQEGGRGGKVLLAHRVSFGKAHGYLPTEVCHTCDNPACVNPGHLFAGSHKLNSKDMVEKDRHPRGERHPKSKLTDELVRAVREGSISSTRAAEKAGCSLWAIYKAKSKTSWRHVQTS